MGRVYAAYYRPGGVYRDLPDRMPQYRESTWTNAARAKAMNENRGGSLLDFLEDFTERFPKYHAEYHTLLTDNRILEAASGQCRCRQSGACQATGFHRCHVARFWHRMGFAQEAALCGL